MDSVTDLFKFILFSLCYTNNKQNGNEVNIVLNPSKKTIIKKIIIIVINLFWNDMLLQIQIMIRVLSN